MHTSEAARVQVDPDRSFSAMKATRCVPVSKLYGLSVTEVHNLFAEFQVLPLFAANSGTSRCRHSNISCSSRRSSSSLADVRSVQDLSFRNTELADAVARDRAMARIRLYESLMPRFEEEQAQVGLAKPRAAIQESELHTFAV